MLAGFNHDFGLESRVSLCRTKCPTTAPPELPSTIRSVSMDESATARYRSLIGYTERGPCPVSMECTFAVVVVAADRRDRMGSRRHFIIVIIIVGVV